MPITLTFDTPEELQAFFQQGGLEGVAVKPRRGRKKATAKTATPKKAAAKKATAKKPAVKKAAKPGPKPGRKKAVAKTAAPKKAAVAKKKPATTKATAAKKPRSANGKGTLTAKIKDTIQKHLDEKKSFTANDIYADLAKQEKGINKQSVITSVLKQMNSTYSDVKVTERPGAGPRPVKLYNP